MAPQTVQCNACGAIYHTVDEQGSEYFHECARVNVDGEVLKREGHRNENRVFNDAIPAHVIAEEGDGVTVLHDGPMNAEDKRGESGHAKFRAHAVRVEAAKDKKRKKALKRK